MKKKNMIKIILPITIIAIILITVVILIVNNKKQKNEIIEVNSDIKPVIYYIYDEVSRNPLLNDTTVLTTATKVSWTKECIGSIKKDGKEFSTQNNTALLESGTYEITTSLPNGKEKNTKTLIIDITPPEVELKENSDGTYTIIFSDINDVETAKLTRLDLETNEVISEKDLKENGLQKEVDVKDKGYYILKATDKNGNTTSNKLSFEIE